LFACLLLAGCAGGPGPLPAGLLETAGLRKPPPLPEAQLPPRKVALRLHAATRLNLDPRGQPLALLVRIYKLRQRTAFDQAPYSPSCHRRPSARPWAPTCSTCAN
jgi:type VI secretion system protein VasD